MPKIHLYGLHTDFKYPPERNGQRRGNLQQLRPLLMVKSNAANLEDFHENTERVGDHKEVSDVHDAFPGSLGLLPIFVKLNVAEVILRRRINRRMLIRVRLWNRHRHHRLTFWRS